MKKYAQTKVDKIKSSKTLIEKIEVIKALPISNIVREQFLMKYLSDFERLTIMDIVRLTGYPTTSVYRRFKKLNRKEDNVLVIEMLNILESDKKKVRENGRV